MNSITKIKSFGKSFILFLLLMGTTLFIQSQTVEVSADLNNTDGPLNHIWSKSVGSDRAEITLREQWRKDVKRFNEEGGMERVRFHGILNDEMGVYGPSIQNRKKEPNWINVDRVYDGILDLGMKPIVEISFMPGYLKSGEATFGAYKGNITPPKSYEEWNDFMKLFLNHLIDRYGIEEIRNWPFEVWNEPNLPFFWTGTMEDYFKFYAETSKTIKSVDKDIMVGGPVTSSGKWIPEFLKYCEENSLPLDFVDTHVYVGDNQEKLFGKKDAFKLSDVIPEGAKMIRAQIDATSFKGLPLWLTEWSADSPAMIVDIIKNCMNSVALMSQWAGSGDYEELGVLPFILKEGNNGYGMFASGGIPKPQFNTYKLLNKMGKTQLKSSEGPIWASRTNNGGAAIMVWNLAQVKQPAGIPGGSADRTVVGEEKEFKIHIKGAKSGQKIEVSYVSMEKGSPFPYWRAIGSPLNPTPKEMNEIKKSAELATPEIMKLDAKGNLILKLAPEEIALIEIKK